MYQFVDFIPNVLKIANVRDKIRHALQKVILYSRLNSSLVQVWEAMTTLEGHTLLPTQNQPFAIGTKDIMRLINRGFVSILIS